MINFTKVLSGLDVLPLLQQLQQHPELWNIDDSWTKGGSEKSAIKSLDNIPLRMNKFEHWNKPAFFVLTEAQKLVFDVMRAVPGELLGKAIIIKLSPGDIVPPHVDTMPPGIPRIYERYQIPLSGPREVEFVVGDERLYLEPGNAYWFQSRLMHSMVNNSSSDRISILVDIKPFLLTEVEEPAAPPLSSIMVGAQPPTRYPPGWTATASERLLESRPIAGLTEGHLSEVDVRGS